MRRLVVASVVLTSSALVLLAVRGRAGGAKSRAPVAPADPTVEVDHQLAQIRGELRHLRADVDRARAAVPAESPLAPKPAPPLEPDGPDDPQERVERGHAFHRAQAELLASTFDREPRDPAWSSDAMALVRKQYAADKFASVKIEPDCKTTLCRLDLRFESPDVAERLAQDIGMNVPWPAQGYFSFDAQTARGVFYVARQDHPLARVSSPAP